MTNTKHTPGPWAATYTPKSRSYSIMSFTGHKEDNGAARVGSVDTCHVTKDQALANTFLIAAAPDLLEALQRMNNRGWFAQTVCASDEENADMAFARAAIAKAEAEGGAS